MTTNFWPMFPEIFVSLAACAILVVDLYAREEQKGNIAYIASIVTLVLALIFTLGAFSHERSIMMDGLFVDDTLSDLIKVGVYLISIGVFVYSRDYARERDLYRGEYYVLGLFGIVGMMVMASSNHFLTLYLGLELLSLCLYAMVAFQRDSSLATEAAMKYFVLGALASGILLYGFSIIYGMTGSLEIQTVQTAIAGISPNNIALIFGLVFVIVGLTFKLGAVPFHMWLPDVYHGAPTSSTVFLGAAPKLAAFALVIRLLVGGFEDLYDAWRDMLIIISMLSIAIGNVVAIAQTNIKRMLAYSTISHMGFFLLGVLAGSESGYGGALFYILVYSVMSLGAFGMIILLSRSGFEAEELDDFRGLNQRNSWYALLMLLLMFSLAGVPPTVGFYAKLAVIQAVVGADLVWVAVVAVLFAVVGAFYYLRVVKLMYFDEAVDQSAFRAGGDMRVMLSINALAVLLIMPWVGALLQICRDAVSALSG